MVTIHPLISQLSKLRDSSKEAVADAQFTSDDELKKYLHVEREVEKDLRRIIISASNSTRACLVLVCGNVGDGKSHLLSKLNGDPQMEQYLKGFSIHNDATESFSPDKTCIDTLMNVLDPFTDDNIDHSEGKWILAINLGTLSNFLEEKGHFFTKLNLFVNDNGIIDPNKYQLRDQFDPKSNFQFVNFTNHHFYDLTASGIKPTLLDELLGLVVARVPQNPIFSAYKSLLNEEWFSRCPVKVNFEILSNELNRKVICRLLVECILKDKLIISFRQILNFIHDILVPYELISLDLVAYKKRIASFSGEERLNVNLFNYIFERPQISKVFSSIHKLDPAVRRYEQLDSRQITIFTSINPVNVFETDFPDLNEATYESLSVLEHVSPILFKSYLRLRYFYHPDDPIYEDDYFRSFTKALYFSNVQDSMGLIEINELVKHAVLLWNGSTSEKDKMMFNSISRHSSYRLFRNVSFKAVMPDRHLKKDEHILHQFLTEVKVEYQLPPKPEDPFGKKVKINVDYSLFVLLKKVRMGYRPNKLDRNSFVNFVTMVDQLIYDNSERNELYVDEVNIGKALDFKLIHDEYGRFKFSKY